jgi:hypothetical protein
MDSTNTTDVKMESSVPSKKLPTFTKVTAQKMYFPSVAKHKTTGEPEYTLNCVVDAKARAFKCTKTVWLRADSAKYQNQFKNTFTLGINEETGLVEYIDSNEKQDFFTQRGGTPERTNQGGLMADAIPYLVLSTMTPGIVETKHRPSNVKDRVVNEIREAVLQNSTIKVGDVLLGKYLVCDIRNGGDMIYVDPTER